jgi:hypothetical protein
MRLAEWSDEAAVENQKNIAVSLEAAQGHRAAVEIIQGEVWCGGVKGYFGHNNSPFLFLDEELTWFLSFKCHKRPEGRLCF